MKRHSLVLPVSERWEYPEDAYFRLDFASRHISSSLCVTDPLPTGLNGDGKNVQTLWWAELDRLHSMTRAHPPLPPAVKRGVAPHTSKQRVLAAISKLRYAFFTGYKNKICTYYI